VVRRETGGWKWPALQFCYMGLLAYVGALVAYQLVGGNWHHYLALLP
jgi:ferrous iron transport protein B